jgi:hypothetical protein
MIVARNRTIQQDWNPQVFRLKDSCVQQLSLAIMNSPDYAAFIVLQRARISWEGAYWSWNIRSMFGSQRITKEAECTTGLFGWNY